MKIRQGFVSNSSSSSFVCNVCGETNCGYDASLSDFDMVQCVHGHTICNSHILDVEITHETLYNRCKEDIEEDIKYAIKHKYNDDIINRRKNELVKFEELYINNIDESDEFENFINEYFNDQIQPEQCPICQLKHIDDFYILEYVMRTNKLNKPDLVKEMQDNFANFKDMSVSLNKEDI